MKRNSSILAVLGFLMLAVIAQAQPHDYEYTSNMLPGARARFRLSDSSITYTTSANKAFTFRMPARYSHEAVFAMVKQAGKKFPAADALLLNQAVAKWDSAKMFLGYTMLPSGLGVRVDRQGSGAQVQNGQTVQVHYRGMLVDGTVFDSSFERNEPFKFKIGQGQVIKGWEEGIPQFQVGGKGRLLIPPALGYGPRGAGGVIPPNAYLIFDVEVLGVE